MAQNIHGVSLFSAYKFKNSWLLHKLPDQYFLEPSDDGGDHEKYVSLFCFWKSWAGQDRTCWLVIDCEPFSPHTSGSKSQNCLWNSLIDGLTGNAKEKPRPTIVHDPRPPEEILADELPQLDSPEALVKTSFRFGGLQSICSFLFAAELFQSSWVHRQRGQQITSFLCAE